MEGRHGRGRAARDVRGEGTRRYADGNVAVGVYKAGDPFGEGVAWSADGQSAIVCTMARMWRRFRSRSRVASSQSTAYRCPRLLRLLLGHPMAARLPPHPLVRLTRASKVVDGVYKGERNAAGEREGYGTMRWAERRRVRRDSIKGDV